MSVFLCHGGFGKPDLAFSTHEKAERHILAKIRDMASRGNSCGFIFSFYQVQVDGDGPAETRYTGSISIGDGYASYVVKRAFAGCETGRLRGKVRMNLTYKPNKSFGFATLNPEK